ncbi:hypothetical protein EV426DRAFT_663462 [Tirmania nivea]|nr:hypothetical protein EV426DRAFT_663462 [Tirmania nivea]
MESSPHLPPISSPPPAARDSDSPISDCIVVRDCDSSSVVTMDTAITSIAPTSDASKGNSRAGSIPTQMDTTEDAILSSPAEAQLVPEAQLEVKLKIEQTSNKAETLEAEEPQVQPKTYPVAETEIEVKDEPELAVTSAITPTRCLRQRPPRMPPVVKSPKSARKPRQPAEEENTIKKLPSPQLSDVIQIRDPAEMKKIRPEEGNRRRSSRLSLLSSNISKVVDVMQTPKRNVGKRSHEMMSAGSKSADTKLASRSWGKWQGNSKKVKAKGESSDDEEDSSEEEASSEEEEEEEEEAQKKKEEEEEEEEEEGEDEKKPQMQKKQKVWAMQGLFVGQEDKFDSRRRTKRGRLSGAGALPKKPKPILPLPMHQGLALMDNRRDFKLPFNVFSPTPYKVHPPGWKSLSRNILVGDARDLWKSDAEPTGKCTCTLETGCDENCLNRCVYYECNDENCNVGTERCQNRQFAALKARVMKKTKFAEGVEVIQTKDRGFGLRATRSFEPNQIIVEYCGEIISQEETESRMKKIYKNNSSYYLMLFDQSMIIDATRGSVARFVNHSCEPNCRMEKWIVDNKPRMALFAGENGVETGEELTYDYNFNWFSGVSQQVCRCGSSKCRGAMGKRSDGRKPPSEVKPSTVKAKKKITRNRIRASITVGVDTKASAKPASGIKKPNRPFKIVKKTVVKKMVNKKVIKKTVVKGPAAVVAKGLKSLGAVKKPLVTSIGARIQNRANNKTYASASRSIKVEGGVSEVKDSATEGKEEETPTVPVKRGPGRPRRNPLGNIETLAKTLGEKTGLQGTVLDTIVVVG